jgi:oxygen-independent coproporphyrinogen-3 oxidase
MEKLPLDAGKSHKLTEDDLVRMDIIQKGILTYYQINKKEINKKFNIDFDDYFRDEMKKLLPFKNDNVITFHDHVININDYGKFIAKHIAFVFDKYY